MNKVMLVFGGAAAAVLVGATALAQAPSDNSAATGVMPLTGQAAADEAQREGASPGVMGPMPRPGSGSSNSSSPMDAYSGYSGANSAGQHSSDTAAKAPSARGYTPSGETGDAKGAMGSDSSAATGADARATGDRD